MSCRAKRNVQAERDAEQATRLLEHVKGDLVQAREDLAKAKESEARLRGDLAQARSELQVIWWV